MRYRKTKRNGKTLYVHRVVAEQTLGRPLKRTDIVHHRNHKALDNRPSNLKVTTAKEHSRHHMLIHPLTKGCVICDQSFTPPPSHRPRDLTCSSLCKGVAIAVARFRRQDKTVDFVAVWSARGSLRAIGKRHRISHHSVCRIKRWPPGKAKQANAYQQRTVDDDADSKR